MHVHTSLAGNLVEDPTYRITPAGHAVLNLRVAVNDRYQDHTTGEWKDGTTVYLTVTGWRRLAENTAESLHKGDGVLIIGQLAHPTRLHHRDRGEAHHLPARRRPHRRQPRPRHHHQHPQPQDRSRRRR